MTTIKKSPGKVRDTETGRYTKKERAKTDPKGTVTERDRPKPKKK